MISFVSLAQLKSSGSISASSAWAAAGLHTRDELEDGRLGEGMLVVSAESLAVRHGGGRMGAGCWVLGVVRVYACGWCGRSGGWGIGVPDEWTRWRMRMRMWICGGWMWCCDNGHVFSLERQKLNMTRAAARAAKGRPYKVAPGRRRHDPRPRRSQITITSTFPLWPSTFASAFAFALRHRPPTPTPHADSDSHSRPWHRQTSRREASRQCTAPTRRCVGRRAADSASLAARGRVTLS